MAIPIPQWLEPSAAQGWGDIAAKGQQLQLERARIQQQGVIANMEAQSKREQQQAESARQQQQIQYEKSYRDAQLGLQQQEQDLKQQQFQQQVKNAATRSAAMMRISQRIAAGEDPSRVYMEEGPAAGATADTLMKSNRGAAFIPKTITGNQGAQYTELSPNHWKITGNVFDQPKGKAAPMDSTTVRQVLNPNYTPGGNQPQFISLTNKTTRTPAGQAQANEPTQKDIDHLIANPDVADLFNKEFGEGAADEFLKPDDQQESQADQQ